MDGLGFDTSGLALGESDEPRVRTLGAGNSNALTFLIDMPLGAARLRQLRQDPALGQGRQAALQVRAVQVRRLLRRGVPEGPLEGPQGRLPRGERLLDRSSNI